MHEYKVVNSTFICESGTAYYYKTPGSWLLLGIIIVIWSSFAKISTITIGWDMINNSSCRRYHYTLLQIHLRPPVELSSYKQRVQLTINSWRTCSANKQAVDAYPISTRFFGSLYILFQYDCQLSKLTRMLELNPI